MTIEWHTCPTCKITHLGRTITIDPPDSICRDCWKAANDDGEFASSKSIRCPKCGETDSEELWDFGLYDEANSPAEVTCCHCNHDYEVEIEIEYTWTSPPMDKDRK